MYWVKSFQAIAVDKFSLRHCRCLLVNYLKCLFLFLFNFHISHDFNISKPTPNIMFMRLCL